MSGGANSSGYESQGYGLNRGYESPNSSKKWKLTHQIKKEMDSDRTPTISMNQFFV